jgi:error-prone DNA polymerase
VHDIVRSRAARGILCQGRGSAANSAVCYCLGITEVDPARMEMLFERFISKERNEPPDIDVDFEHERREEVIQYIYAKYGRERAALAATVITYRPRSAIRDVGKALGSTDCRSTAREVAAVVGRPRGRRRALREAGFDPRSPRSPALLELTRELIGFPRHLSQHVGGFVISRATARELVPIENAAMPERTVIQWDKDDLDALGLLKVDVLALGMLSAIRRARLRSNAFRGAALDAAARACRPRIPAEDPDTEMISRADTVGVFQIESRAQMAMLPRLKPRCFYDLVIEVAIVRPGPIQGDMVHPYLRRRQGLEPVEYPSDEVRRARAHARRADLPGAGDAARDRRGRLHAGRGRPAAPRDGRLARKGGLARFEQKLIDGMLARGYSRGVRASGSSGRSRASASTASRSHCGELRAAGVRLGVAQAPRARRRSARRC